RASDLVAQSRRLSTSVIEPILMTVRVSAQKNKQATRDAMTEAFIFAALRTPRGRGKPGGALYSVKPVNLMAGLLSELQVRNHLDTSQVDDIVLGCVTPVGDQGADIAKTAALVANWAVNVAGVQIN